MKIRDNMHVIQIIAKRLFAMNPMESWKDGLHVPVKIRNCVDCALGFDFSSCTLWTIQSELQYSEGQMAPQWAYISLCARGRDSEEGKDWKCSRDYQLTKWKGKGLPEILLKTRRQRNNQRSPHVSSARKQDTWRTVLNIPHGMKRKGCMWRVVCQVMLKDSSMLAMAIKLQ